MEMQIFLCVLKLPQNLDLYDGCHTENKKLSVLKNYFSVKNKSNILDTKCLGMMKVVNEILPRENNLSACKKEAKKLIKDLGLPYIKILACKKNCMFFYDRFNDLMHCEMCYLERFTEDGLHHHGNLKLKLNKVLHYLPITHCLKQLISHKKWAGFMSYHVSENANANDIIGQPNQSQAWKHLDNFDPDFPPEVGIVRLGLCINRFNALSNMASTYTMWLLFIIVYNLPSNLYMKQLYIYML